ncbi:MAG: 50S ribosomal protein L16 [Nanoarchaeota archaeon]|nr:50S ribosomal protein L16 [Nanoarchaeota archaeon]
MASLRAFSCYRKPKRAYTRKSKYKKKAFIKSVPNLRLVKFDFGNLKKDFSGQLDLVSKEKVQIRDNALESARQVTIRKLNKLGKQYHFKVRVYPHNVLRENKMLTGAGADRMQTGMQHSFGKATGCAAVLKVNQPIFTLYTDKENLELMKPALKASIKKFPCKCAINKITK